MDNITAEIDALLLALDDSHDWYEADEVWKPIPGFADYEVSDRCRFRSFKRGMKFLKPSLSQGRLYISLTGEAGRQTHQLAHWLLRAFVSECPGKGWHAAHENGDALDNRLENLCWKPQSDNEIDKLLHGKNPNAKLTPADVLVIRHRFAEGATEAEIRADYGLSRSQTNKIKLGKKWKWVA